MLYDTWKLRPMATYRVTCSGKTSEWMCVMRSPPGVYSITKQAWSGVWKHANMFTRKGWPEELTTSKMRFSQCKLQGFKVVKWQHQSFAKKSVFGEGSKSEIPALRLNIRGSCSIHPIQFLNSSCQASVFFLRNQEVTPFKTCSEPRF